jgi:hypothetical protein
LGLIFLSSFLGEFGGGLIFYFFWWLLHPPYWANLWVESADLVLGSFGVSLACPS